MQDEDLSEPKLSEGLLYKYFRSKDEIFVSLLQMAVEGSMEAFRAVYQSPESPLEQLRTLSEHILDEENKDSFLFIH